MEHHAGHSLSAVQRAGSLVCLVACVGGGPQGTPCLPQAWPASPLCSSVTGPVSRPPGWDMDRSQHPALQAGLGTVRATPAGLFSKEKRTETPFGGLGASLRIVEDQAKCLKVGNLERAEADCSRGGSWPGWSRAGRAPSPWGRPSAVPRPSRAPGRVVFPLASALLVSCPRTHCKSNVKKISLYVFF